MTATKNEHQLEPDPVITKTKKPKPPPPPEMPLEGSAANWNESLRRVVALRLAEHLDDGVELASEVCNDPYSRSPDDRITATFAVARMINANAHLGRAIANFAQVEQRRRMIVERVEAPSPVLNDSISIQDVQLARDMTNKMFRYMKVLCDETFDPAIEEAAQAEAAKAEAAKAEAAKAEAAKAKAAEAKAAKSVQAVAKPDATPSP
jgi:hypothetical protein